MRSVIRFAIAVVLVVAGAACVLAVGGVAGDAVGMALIAVGAIGAVSLVFYEIGLGEDRQRRRR